MKKIDFSKLKTAMSIQNVQSTTYAGESSNQFKEYQMPTPSLIKNVLK